MFTRTAALLLSLLLLTACTSAPPAWDPMGRRTEATDQPGAVTWRSSEQRLELLRTANKTRNEIEAQFPPPIGFAHRTSEAPKLDGKLDEAAWKNATVITDLVGTRDGKPVAYQSRFRLLWDAKYLYVGVDSDDPNVLGTLTEHDAELWREDAVEVFIDADGDGMSYVEYELSPLGTWYDAALADYRPETPWHVNANHLDIDRSITMHDTRHTRWAVHVDGTLNDDSDVDRGWSAEIAIAWQDIARGTNVRVIPPSDGDMWRIGLYVINVKAGDKPDQYAAWNATGTWFHRPWSFGRVVFVNR